MEEGADQDQCAGREVPWGVIAVVRSKTPLMMTDMTKKSEGVNPPPFLSKRVVKSFLGHKVQALSIHDE